tara:strand:+ start:653 stop:865 length:213 start_codon:yes stop_codon:yes gene_type:complete
MLGVFAFLSLIASTYSKAEQSGIQKTDSEFYREGEKQPMAVMCDHGLFFYTTCGLSGGGCSETSCDKPIE